MGDLHPDIEPPMVTYALEHVAAGRPVIPLHGIRLEGPHRVCTCAAGAACSSPGKHPRLRAWQSHATRDPAQVRTWWDLWPDANVGMPTGLVSGVVVLDVDPRSGGEESLALLERTHGRLPATISVTTGSGGRHLFFQLPTPPPGNTSLATGLDVRGEGGQVAAVGSRHVSGQRYAWIPGYAPGEIPGAPVPAPEWLVALLTTPTPVAGSTSPGSLSTATEAPIIQGNRNRNLTQLAGAMRARGTSEATLLAALLAENQTRCRPPLPEAEVRKIAASVARYKPSETWQVEVQVPDEDAAGQPFTTIQPLLRIGTDPPRYVATVRGEQLPLALNDLLNWAAFRRRCVAQLHWLPQLPIERDKDGERVRPQALWETRYVAPALEAMVEQHTMEDAPADAGAAGVLWDAVQQFLRAVRVDTDRARLTDNHLVLDAVEQRYLFRGRLLRSWLAANTDQTGVLPPAPDDLFAVVREHGGDSRNVRVQQQTVWVWSLPASAVGEDLP